MKLFRSTKKIVVSFCCAEMFHQICSDRYPEYRISFDTNSRYYPYNGKHFKYCPFCGDKKRTIFKLADGEIRKN